MGIARQIKAALKAAGIAEQNLDDHIGLLDSKGLLVTDQQISDHYKQELAWNPESAQRYALEDSEKRDLLSVVRQYKPTVLIGSSGQTGAFNEDVVRTMFASCKRPVILPLSNPTSSAEAVPADLLQWTDGQAIIATGSPFEPVEFNGVTHRFGQGNNVFIFPALGFATMLGNVREVSDDMITAAAQSLAEAMHQDELDQGLLYPEVSRLRETTHAVTVGVLRSAINEDVADLQKGTDLETLVKESMWDPGYD